MASRKPLVETRRVLPLFGDGPIIGTLAGLILMGSPSDEEVNKKAPLNILSFLAYPARVVLRHGYSIRAVGWIMTILYGAFYIIFLNAVEFMDIRTGKKPFEEMVLSVTYNMPLLALLFVWAFFLLSPIHIIMGYIKAGRSNRQGYKGIPWLYSLGRVFNHPKTPEAQAFFWVVLESVLLAVLSLVCLFVLKDEGGGWFFGVFGGAYFLTEAFERYWLQRPHDR